ncbi:MAG: ABC transporter ATP-binding protein, partial [Alphaproteobacteria bacterium]
VEVEAETPLNEKTVTLVLTAGKREILISRPAGTPGPVAGPAHILVDGKTVLLFDKTGGALIRAGGETIVSDGNMADGDGA